MNIAVIDIIGEHDDEMWDAIKKTRASVWLSSWQEDPQWRDLILFYEYFHVDNGAGIGASHQTGWTGLIAPILDLSSDVSVPTPFWTGDEGVSSPEL